MELDTHGQEAALLAPTRIREDRTPPGKCCGSSSSIPSHGSRAPIEVGQLNLAGNRGLMARSRRKRVEQRTELRLCLATCLSAEVTPH